jgi:putative ABC transport system ATP-binding protein
MRLTLLLGVLATAGQLVVPVAVQQIIDGQILSAAGPGLGGVLAWGAAALAVLALATLCSRMMVVRLVTTTSGGLAELRVKVFGHIHRLAMLTVQGERRGALVSRVTNDINTITEFLEFGGIGLLIGSAQVCLAIAIMFVYRWQLAVVVLAGLIVYIGMLSLFQRILQRAQDRVREAVAATLAVTSETISGLPVVRAHGVESTILAKVRVILDGQRRAEHRANSLSAELFSSAELFAAGIIVAVVAVGVLTGGSSAGTLVAFLFLVNLMIEPVQTLVETVDQAQRAAAGVRRVLGVLDTPAEITDPSDGIDLPRGGLGVRFSEVGFSYPEGAEALSGVSLEIEPGRRVAVVGETGSGKTTFAKLVTRLIDPSEGVIEVGGVLENRIRFSSLRSRVAFVPQEGFLFKATIAENVRYGKLDAGEREINAAFYELGLDDWLDRLPDGLATEVGERGSNLSAGERQLVALVRAWISGPDLLVLDEATSAVDPALDVTLRRAIERLTAGHTSITIAHRLATAEAADEILVFDGGRLVERGHHRILLDMGGIYAGLYSDWIAGTKVS